MKEGNAITGPAGNPLGWTVGEYEAWAQAHGEKSFRGRQAATWILSRGVTDPSAMTDLPAGLRQSLVGETAPSLPSVAAERRSADGTAKYLLELADGERVEMVIIPEEKRNTLCFSSQVGCPVGCLFCSTGRGGLTRNLGAAEMVGEVVLARRLLGPERKLTNLVMMGMGEPLLNFDEVARALTIIMAPWGLDIPPRRVTVSTAGIVPRLADLRRLFPALNLAVSVNASNDRLRSRLMPGAARWPLGALMKALSRLPGGSRHPVTLEYVLLGGVNDGREEAAELVRLVRRRGFQVNLIPYNEVPGGEFSAPGPERVEEFARVLGEAGVKVLRRRSRGTDIEAACGQLRAARVQDGEEPRE